VLITQFNVDPVIDATIIIFATVSTVMDIDS